MNTNKPKKFFYGWTVAFACMLIVGAATGFFSNCNGIFVVPVTEDLGITRGAFSLYSSISSLVSLASLLIVGELLHKKPHLLRPLLFIGATVSAVTFFSLSFCSKVWHFYALGVILGFVWPLLGGLTVTTLINNWFVEKRGFVTGLAYAGSGISAAIATPIVTAVVADSGWRAGYRLLGISAAVLFALALLLIRFKPEDIGQTALGADRLVSADGTPPSAVGLTRKEALRTPAFYLMVFGFMCNSFIGMSMSAHANACLTDIGYPKNTVALVMSLIMTVMIFGKILFGIAFDRLGSVRGAYLVGLSVTISALTLRLAGLSPIMPWIYALCFGFGFSTLTVPLPYFAGENFGMLEYAPIYSLSMVFANLASATAQPFAGWVRDITGSYNLVWNLEVLLGIASTAALVASASIARKAGYNPKAKFTVKK